MQKIAQKMVNVMKKCGYIQKQGKNAFHNYKYAMASDVLEKVHDALTENGLVTISIPEIVDFRDVTTSKGNQERLVTVKTTVKIIDSESGETIETVGLGSGQDAGDKAVMKAETASQKYAWMMALLIATGDDPEADEDLDRRTNVQPEPPKNTPQPTQNATKPPAKSNTPAKQNKPAENATGVKINEIFPNSEVIPICPKCNKPLASTEKEAAAIIDYCNKYKGGNIACRACQKG
jgi:hypothetical protein